MTPGFVVKFLIDRVNGLYKIQLTDNTDYSGISTGYGFYKVTYPDGVFTENTDPNNPDFEIGSTSTELNFRVKNSEFNTGQYTVEQKIYTNTGYFTLLKTFTLSFSEPVLKAVDNSSVVIPSVSFLDQSDYNVLGYTHSLTRLFSSFFPSTSDLNGVEKTTSGTELIMVDSGNYYEGIYSPKININATYTGSNHSVNWIIERNFSFDIRKFVGYQNLISVINTYKENIKNPKDEQTYQMIMSLYSHLVAKINSGDTGIQELVSEILELATGSCGCDSYLYQSEPITVDEIPSESGRFPYIDEVVYREWSDQISFNSTSTIFHRVSGKIRWFKSKQNNNLGNPIFIDGVINDTWWEEIFTGASPGTSECLIRTKFTYSGGPKTFNLPYDPEGIFTFHVDGILQDADLVTFSGSQVTFAGTISSGQRVDIVSTGCDFSIVDFDTSDLLKKENFTYVDTNSFILSQIPQEIIMVFLNGKLLDDEDYDLSGDEITINETLSLIPEPDRINVYYSVSKSAFLDYINDILAGINVPVSPTGARWLVTPTIQWTGTGYQFSVSTCSYELPGVEGPVNGIPTIITLSGPDATFDRFDLFTWNNLGQCIIIEGTPSLNPIIEVVDDPVNQIAGQAIRVRTGTTDPSGDITTIIIYDENLEWTTSSVGATVDFDNTLVFYQGSKSVNVSNISVGDYQEYEAPGDFDPTLYNSIGKQLYLKATMQVNQDIGVRFYNSLNQAISDERILSIQKSITGEWQLAAVDISEFTFSSLSARKVRFRWTKGNNDHLGYYADIIQLQSGIIPPITIQTIELTGDIAGTGQTGIPIVTTIQPESISERTEQLIADEDDYVTILRGGQLYKIKTNTLIPNLPDPTVQNGIKTRGTITFDSAIQVDVNGYEWYYDGVLQSGGEELNKAIPGTPVNYDRIDALVGDNTGSYYWIEGSEIEGVLSYPEIPSNRRILEYIIRSTSGSNTLEEVSPDLSIYVDKTSTGTQIVKSFLGSDKIKGTIRDSLYPDANGVFRRLRIDYHGVYSTLSGSSNWSRLIRINATINNQLDYKMSFDLIGVNSQQGQVWIDFELDSSGNMVSNNLQLFGSFTDTRFKMVKIASYIYDVFIQHVDTADFFKWRPKFSFGSSDKYTYFHQEPLGGLPIGDQYDFTVFSTSLLSITGDFVDNSDPINPVVSSEAYEEETNTVPFDDMRLCIIGNAAARTGNILFDFTGAKLGAMAIMYHQDAAAFTFPAEAVLNFDITKISTTARNLFCFLLTDSTAAAEVVEVTLLKEGGLDA